MQAQISILIASRRKSGFEGHFPFVNPYLLPFFSFDLAADKTNNSSRKCGTLPSLYWQKQWALMKRAPNTITLHGLNLSYIPSHLFVCFTLIQYYVFGLPSR